MISAFGVEHGVIAKADALGTPEANMAEAHRAGQHAGNAKRYCALCQKAGDEPKASGLSIVRDAMKAAKAR